MALPAGTKLGPYEVLGELGAGGMGEVYRARDTRLNRTVAIKVLPEHLSSDVGRRARFEREAHTISGLSHPNINAGCKKAFDPRHAQKMSTHGNHDRHAGELVAMPVTA
jgi:serine/threonine protein kinase